MARLVVHIGPGKTGTSFIQTALADQRDYLAARDWIVPQFTSGSHHEVALSLDDRDYLMNIPAVPDLTTPATRLARVDLISRTIAEQVQPNQTWIMSSEYFQLVLRDVPSISRFKDLFGTWFTEITPIAYVRRQDTTVPSLFTESAKTLVTNRREIRYDASFLDDPACIPLDRLKSWRIWHECFGNDFVARPYLDSWRHSPGALLADFVEASGAPLSVEQLDVEQKPRLANESISARGVAFLLAIYPQLNARVLRQTSMGQVGEDNLANLFRRYIAVDDSGAPHFNHGSFTQDVAAATQGPSLRLTAELEQAIHERFDADNTELARAAGMTAGWQEWLSSAGAPVGPDDQLSIDSGQVEGIVETMLFGKQRFRSRARSRLHNMARRVRAR